LPNVQTCKPGKLHPNALFDRIATFLLYRLCYNTTYQYQIRISVSQPLMEMDGKAHFESDGIRKTISPESSRSSIASDAKKILTIFLTKNANLEMPAAVTEYASSVTFTPNVSSFLPTPMKMSESASAMWACIGLFASAICRERYNAGEPKRIVVDVYSATLMLCSVFLFQINGKIFTESQAAPRATHLDRGRNRETYRNVISNM
jgi:hypothetical protein